MWRTWKIVLVGGGKFLMDVRVSAISSAISGSTGARWCCTTSTRSRSALTFRLALRYKETTGTGIVFESSTDQAAAFEGADYVVVTISTGGLRTMRVEYPRCPEKYGIFQTVAVRRARWSSRTCTCRCS